VSGLPGDIEAQRNGGKLRAAGTQMGMEVFGEAMQASRTRHEGFWQMHTLSAILQSYRRGDIFLQDSL